MKVYLSENIAPSAYKRLKEQYEIVDNFEEPELLDAIIVRRAYVSRDIIERAKRLKVISMHGVGVDTIDVEAASEYGIPVVNVPGESAESVAELALSFMLALSRKIKYVNIALGNGALKQFGAKEITGNEIYGKTLGLVGGGRIAQQLANMARAAFSMKVYCYDPFLPKEALESKGFIKTDSLKELFRICDFVSVHVPLCDTTKNLIGEDVLSFANPDLILVNTARGGIVDEKALYQALIHKRIRAAGSDVFEEEVPEKENPLLHLDNFIATLHVGGSTEEALERVSNKAVDHVLEYLEK